MDPREVLRQRAGLGPSSSIPNPMGGGMGGGMTMNPISMGRTPTPPAMQRPGANPQASASQGQRVQPDESSLIVRALIERLRQLTPKQNAQTA